MAVTDDAIGGGKQMSLEMGSGEYREMLMDRSDISEPEQDRINSGKKSLEKSKREVDGRADAEEMHARSVANARASVAKGVARLEDIREQGTVRRARMSVMKSEAAHAMLDDAGRAADKTLSDSDDEYVSGEMRDVLEDAVYDNSITDISGVEIRRDLGLDAADEMSLQM